MTSLILGGLVVLIVTTIVTEAFVFSWLRDLAWKVHRHVGYLFTCFLCFGTWVGVGVGFLIDGPLHPVLDGLAYHGLAYLLHTGVGLVSDIRTRLQR